MTLRTTRITVEHNTILVVHNASVERAWCPVCCAEADVISIGSKSPAEVLASNEGQEWIATGKFHVSSQPNQPVRICLTSLLRCFEPMQKMNYEKETI